MYWKILLGYYVDGKRVEYNAYTTGYDRKEARSNIRSELLADEADDEIISVMQIDEDEYVNGCKEYGNGVRR